MSRVITVGAAQMGPIQKAESRASVVARLLALMECCGDRRRVLRRQIAQQRGKFQRPLQRILLKKRKLPLPGKLRRRQRGGGRVGLSRGRDARRRDIAPGEPRGRPTLLGRRHRAGDARGVRFTPRLIQFRAEFSICMPLRSDRNHRGNSHNQCGFCFCVAHSLNGFQN